MVDPVNPDLLSDLARLAGRYPPEEWQRLIQWLEDASRRRDLALVLDELAAASTRRRARPSAKRHPARSQPVPKRIDVLRTSDPERAKVLEDLWRRLRGRELFPDMGSLRAFAETAGMKEFRPTKREQAITALLRHLIELPLAELRTTLARPVTSTAARTDEYERWVELILGRGEPPGTTSRGEQIARPSEPEASVDRDPD